MNRFLLGCFLLLFSLIPAHAQLRTGVLRTPPLAKTATALTGLETLVERAVEQSVLRTTPSRIYRLARLPNYLPTPVQLPAFPLPQNVNNMYRGMALEFPNEQLKHIWKNGLEVYKCKAGNFAAYDGINSACAEPAIYASTDPDLALGYTSIRVNDPTNARFPVLFHLKRLGNSLTISIPHDVPPQWIEHVSTVLWVDGQLRWGELELDDSNHFIFTPYAVPAP